MKPTTTVEDKQIGEWTLRFIRGAKYSGRELIALLIHADGKHVGSPQVLALVWRLGSEMIRLGYAPRLTDCGMVVLMGGGKVAAGIEFEAGDAKLEAEIEAVVRDQLA